MVFWVCDRDCDLRRDSAGTSRLTIIPMMGIKKVISTIRLKMKKTLPIILEGVQRNVGIVVSGMRRSRLEKCAGLVFVGYVLSRCAQCFGPGTAPQASRGEMQQRGIAITA